MLVFQKICWYSIYTKRQYPIIQESTIITLESFVIFIVSSSCFKMCSLISRIFLDVTVLHVLKKNCCSWHVVYCKFTCFIRILSDTLALKLTVLCQLTFLYWSGSTQTSINTSNSGCLFIKSWFSSQYMYARNSCNCYPNSTFSPC